MYLTLFLWPFFFSLFLLSVNQPGGSLEYVIGQDGCLREDVVRKFGWDLVKGLKYIHELGIILSDLNPAKVWIHSFFLLLFFLPYSQTRWDLWGQQCNTAVFAISRFSWMEVIVWSIVTSICPKRMGRLWKISLLCSPSARSQKSKIARKRLKTLGKGLKVWQ